MPEINGIELIKYTSEHFPSIPKLVITGYPSVDTAINAVKSGALDYLIKPFTGEEFKKAIQNCLKNDAIKPNQPIERKNLIWLLDLNVLNLNNDIYTSLRH